MHLFALCACSQVFADEYKFVNKLVQLSKKCAWVVQESTIWECPLATLHVFSVFTQRYSYSCYNPELYVCTVYTHVRTTSKYHNCVIEMCGKYTFEHSALDC